MFKKKTNLLLGSGTVVDLNNVADAHISIDDIGFALHRIARFNGQPNCGIYDGILQPMIYTVADHCLGMAKYFEAREELRLAKAAMWHDAAEALIGDIPTPVKQSLPQQARDALELLEANIMANLSAAYDFDLPCKRVKEVDYAFCYAEAIQFFGKDKVKKNFEKPRIKPDKIIPFIQIHQCGIWPKVAHLMQIPGAIKLESKS